MIKKLKIVCLLLPFFCVVQACNAAHTDVKVEQTATAKMADKKEVDDMEDKLKQENVWRKGTVKFMNFEGGFFGIVDENGQKLLPMKLAPEFRQDGTIIKFKGKANHDMMTIMQWGTVFELTEVELLKAGEGSAKDNLY